MREIYSTGLLFDERGMQSLELKQTTGVQIHLNCPFIHDYIFFYHFSDEEVMKVLSIYSNKYANSNFQSGKKKISWEEITLDESTDWFVAVHGFG